MCPNPKLLLRYEDDREKEDMAPGSKYLQSSREYGLGTQIPQTQGQI